MSETTARLELPLLAPGQAQKELFHNEALTLIDIAVQASVVAVGLDTPPAAPALGACWIVGAAPTGDWAGQAGALAGWTAGGWRFVEPHEGLAVWQTGTGMVARRIDDAWVSGVLSATRLVIGGDQVVGARQPAIAPPTGGGVIDADARAALSAMLGALRAHGLIAP